MDRGWMVGEAVIAKWSVDDKWYRAVVLIVRKSKKQIWIHFVDYGTQEWMHQKHLRRTLFTHDIPIQSWTIKLHGVAPLNDVMQWPQDVLDLLHTKIVNKKVTVQLTPGSTSLPVYASVVFGAKTIQEFLVENQYARWI